MFRVCVLGSGSGGNCTAVWTRRTRVLIDAGLSQRRTLRELGQLGLARMDGILITHAHGDHVGWTTYELSRECRIPVYCNRTTWRVAVRKCEELAELETGWPRLVRFFDGSPFSVGDLRVSPFRVPHAGLGQRNGRHHAGLPVGFAITHERRGRTYGLGYATDLGHVPARIVEQLSDVDVLVIEANHCERLVDKLGQFHGHWVKSPLGHMNNLAAGKAIARIARGRPKPLHVLLAHLSQDHNTPARAMHQVSSVLEEREVELAGLYLTHQDRRSRTVDIIREDRGNMRRQIGNHPARACGGDR